MRTKQCKNKGIVVGGKVHDKDKGIIVQSVQHNRIHSLNRTVLINERSMGKGGNIGASNDREE